MNGQISQITWRTITRLLLAANFFFGFAVIAMLPPFEGIDETAHFSRFQSQVFAPLVPRAEAQKEENAPRLTQEIFDYYRRGPMPCHWIYFEDLHQRDPLRGYMTYRDFFNKSDKVANYIQLYRESILQPGYRPSPEFNWEYQHPAFYYVLGGQAMKFLAGHTSLMTALFALRIMSWILAFAGFCIGLLATRAHLIRISVPGAEIITALGALYPFLAPAFFWELARLGNDSLCLFLFAISWACLLWYVREPRSDAALYIGFFMGLGWLTKALMIPVSAGMVAFVVVHSFFVVRKDPAHAKGWWWSPLSAIGFVALIGTPVYIINYLSYGSWGPRVFTVVMNTDNGTLRLLQNFSWHDLKLGLQGIFYTGVWLAGTSSHMIVDLPVHRALYIFTAIVLLAYLFSLRKTNPAFQLPLWAIVPILFGLIVHIFIVIIVQNNDSTPGYYLHLLAPAWALIYGVGLKNLMDRKWLRPIIGMLFVPIVLLNFFAAWCYATAFAGCTVAVPIDVPFYMLHTADILKCTSIMPLIFERLGVLAWPSLALAGFGLTFILLTTAGGLICKQKVSVS